MVADHQGGGHQGRMKFAGDRATSALGHFCDMARDADQVRLPRKGYPYAGPNTRFGFTAVAAPLREDLPFIPPSP